MTASRSWSTYPVTYRAPEMQKLARWILTNTSGSVVGLAGAGKSNLLGFLCHRPDALQSYIPKLDRQVALIPVDLNSLPANDLATFYRFVLRSLYEARAQFDTQFQENIVDQYRDNRASRDPFVSQSALRELLLLFQTSQIQIVLVLDRFDKFCQEASPQLTDTLRGLRDSFKESLSLIAGMRQEVVYLSDPMILGELYEILDTHVCWVGAMSDQDARRLIEEETRLSPTHPPEAAVNELLALTGRYPSLLKTACHWWLTAGAGLATSLSPNAKIGLAEDWTRALLDERGIHYRLREIWAGLSQEEQLVLSEVQQLTTPGGKGQGARSKGQRVYEKALQDLFRQHERVIVRLEAKGIGHLTENGWHLSSALLAAYVAGVGGRSRGLLRYDEKANVIYQDQTPLENLAPLELSLLRFLLAHPRVRHTYTELIEAAWPEEVHREGVSTEAIYQVVRGLRRQIEPIPSRPRYVVNWRGQPEGGYQCFPEGRPQ